MPTHGCSVVLRQGRLVGERADERVLLSRRPAPGATPHRARLSGRVSGPGGEAVASTVESRSTCTPLARATRPRSVTRPSETSMRARAPAAPRRAGRPATAVRALGGDPAGRARQRRETTRHPAGSVAVAAPVVVATVGGSPLALLEQRQPATGPPERPAHGHDVTGARARAQHRGVAPQVTQGGHRDHDDLRRRPGQVSTHDRRPRPVRERGDTPRQVDRPGDLEVGVGDQRDEQRGRLGSHRGDVGEVLRRDLDPDVVGAGPVVAPVQAPDHRVRRGHHQPPGSADHRCVIAGPDGHRPPLGRQGTGVQREDLFEDSPSLASRKRTVTYLPKTWGPLAR